MKMTTEKAVIIAPGTAQKTNKTALIKFRKIFSGRDFFMRLLPANEA
jgi:hypothetical protein